jgi:hypothetical protein
VIPLFSCSFPLCFLVTWDFVLTRLSAWASSLGPSVRAARRDR